MQIVLVFQHSAQLKSQVLKLGPNVFLALKRWRVTGKGKLELQVASVKNAFENYWLLLCCHLSLLFLECLIFDVAAAKQTNMLSTQFRWDKTRTFFFLPKGIM